MTDATPKTLSPAVVTEEAADEAATFCIEALADILGVTDYAQADGSEEWEGDVRGTIYNVLVAANVVDEDDGRVARLASLASPERPVERERIESALRYARDQADSVYGITWAKLEEISRFELFVQALSLTKPTAILSELSGRSGV